MGPPAPAPDEALLRHVLQAVERVLVPVVELVREVREQQQILGREVADLRLRVEREAPFALPQPPNIHTDYAPTLESPPWICEGPGYPTPQELYEISRAHHQRAGGTVAPEQFRPSPLAMPVGVVAWPRLQEVEIESGRRFPLPVVREHARVPEGQLRRKFATTIHREVPLPRTFAVYLRVGWQYLAVRQKDRTQTGPIGAQHDLDLQRAYEKCLKAAAQRETPAQQEREAYATMLLWMLALRPRAPTLDRFCYLAQHQLPPPLQPTDLRWSPVEILRLWRSHVTHHPYEDE